MCLQEELKEQADAVWRFIMDRQIEAPDEFAALQTHRVQLAVARRQLAFVEQLTEVGYGSQGAISTAAADMQCLQGLQHAVLSVRCDAALPWARQP